MKKPAKTTRFEDAEVGLKSLPPEYSDTSMPVVDIDAAFEMYAQCVGDVPRTAAALNLTSTQVLDMAVAHDWNTRLKDLFELKKSGKPGDIERAINRAINFVLANQYRSVLQRIVRKLHRLKDDELFSEVTIVKCDKDGNEIGRSFSSRALTDLAAAIEKMTACTYAALNDTATERTQRRDAGEGNISLGAIHQAISQSMSDAKTGAKREEFSDKLAQAKAALSDGNV